MGIETSEPLEAKQTELAVESQTERLTRLLNLDLEIMREEAELENAKAIVNGKRNQLKIKKHKRNELLTLIYSGQETLIPVAMGEGDNGADASDNDSDDEDLDLSSYYDKDAEDGDGDEGGENDDDTDSDSDPSDPDAPPSDEDED